MKRVWLFLLLVVPVLLGYAPVTFAAKTYPSVVGDWQTAGTMTGKLCVQKYGCEHVSEPFLASVSFYEDHSLALDSETIGQWAQSKGKITADLNVAEIESMLNDLLYQELGGGFYIDITGMSFKAQISKDGNQILNGKLYIKYEFIFEYYGAVFNGKGNISEKFTGTRTVSSRSSLATENEEEQDMSPAFVRQISKLLADNLLSKTGH